MEFATELGVLTCLMILAASMWIPYVVGIATDPSKEEAFEAGSGCLRQKSYWRKNFR